MTNKLPVRTKLTKLFTLILLAAVVFAASPVVFAAADAHGREGHALTALDVCGSASGVENSGSTAPFVCEAHFDTDLSFQLSHAIDDTHAFIPIVTPDVVQRPPQV
jgi:hypothetical protein